MTAANDTESRTGTLAEALADLQTQLPHIAKNNTANAGTYKYSYADLAEITRELMPIMGKLGLSFSAKPTRSPVDGKRVLVYKLRHISGESDEGEWDLPDRGSPQEIGSAITYMRRYCLCAVTGLAPDNDDEDAVLAESAARRMRVEKIEEKIAAAQAPQEPRINAEQTKELQNLFQAVGITDKAKRIDYAVAVVKRKVGSATELTQTEASQVIESLQRAAEKRAEAAAGGEQNGAGEAQ